MLSELVSHPVRIQKGGVVCRTVAPDQFRAIEYLKHWNERGNRGLSAEGAVCWDYDCWDVDRMRRTMARFYQPDLSSDLDSPFIRDGEDKLIRRSYWLDMDDRTLVMVMVNGIGANLTNNEKRAHLIDLRREHLIEQVCIQEILPPER